MSQDKAPIDHLIDGSRIRGQTRVIADGTVPEAISDAQAAQVIANVLSHASAAGVSRTQIAKALGIGVPVLGSLLNGQKRGAWQAIILDLDRWLELETASEDAKRPSEFVWTAVAEEVLTVSDVTCMLKTIGLVYGPNASGIGKSMALRAVAELKPGSALVSIDTASTSPLGILQAISKGLRLGGGTNARIIFQQIRAALAGTPRLLMIDEIHKLCGIKDDKPLHVLRDLYDATGSPQLWCGTVDLVGYLDRGQGKGKEPLAQIRSRIGICRDLTERTRSSPNGPGRPLFTVQEIIKIFAGGKMRLTPDAARYLAWLANEPDSGALRTCKNLVLMAETIYTRTNEALSADMLRAAFRLLVSGNRFALLEAKLHDQHQPAAVARVG